MNGPRALTLALALLATWSGPATAATRVGEVASRSSGLVLSKATVTAVDQQAKTFTVEVGFSAADLSELPTVGADIDITYTQTPDGLRATTVKSSKSNSSDRRGGSVGAPKQSFGRVTQVNDRAKTFVVAFVFSAEKLSELPTVGTLVDVTYAGTAEGPMMASNLNLSKSNIN